MLFQHHIVRHVVKIYHEIALVEIIVRPGHAVVLHEVIVIGGNYRLVSLVIIAYLVYDVRLKLVVCQVHALIV